MNKWSVAIILLVLVAAVNLPYLYGHGLDADGKKFTGFFFYEEEGWNYLSKIEQGRAGHLLWRNLYTLEGLSPGKLRKSPRPLQKTDLTTHRQHSRNISVAKITYKLSNMHYWGQICNLKN